MASFFALASSRRYPLISTIRFRRFCSPFPSSSLIMKSGM